MPTLVFDTRANHDTGVSRFALNTLRGAAPLLAEAGWDVTVIAAPGQVVRARVAVAGTDTPVLCCPDDDGFVRRSAWLRELLIERSFDLYFAANYVLDRQCPVPYVMTIHDLTRLKFPHLSYTDDAFARRFGPAQLRLVREELTALADWDTRDVHGDGAFQRYFQALTSRLVEGASRVVTVSDATALDIVTMLGVDPGRLALVPCTVDVDVFRCRGQSEVDAVRRTYGVTGPYLLFVGLTHPNKRLPWLLEQLLDRRDELPERTQLVAVGGYAEHTPEVSRLLAQPGAAEFVVFTGRTSDAELAALYSGASALLTASVSEGSNLPPQEAMACGCSVIATDLPVHRETLGESAAFYDPDSGDELVALARGALARGPARRRDPFRPPGLALAGQRLVDTFNDAIADDSPPARSLSAQTRSGGSTWRR